LRINRAILRPTGGDRGGMAPCTASEQADRFCRISIRPGGQERAGIRNWSKPRALPS